MHTGVTASKVLYLFDSGGNALSYSSAAAFTSAGWNLTWYNTSGVALTTQPAWSLAPLGSGGRHLVTYTWPTGVWQAVPTVPSGMADPGTWGGEGTTYDDDSLGGLIATSQGTPGVQSAADANLGDVVTGDSWNSGTLYIPLGKLTPFGKVYADLASGWTITAGLKSQPADTMVAATATFGTTVATDGAFSIGWTTFPTAMVLASPGTSAQWYIDVQIANAGAGLKITTNRYMLRVVWERDTV